MHSGKKITKYYVESLQILNLCQKHTWMKMIKLFLAIFNKSLPARNNNFRNNWTFYLLFSIKYI